jgi:CheY-like chemotaxis protein
MVPATAHSNAHCNAHCDAQGDDVPACTTPIILVAEDEPINQLLMRSALTRAGFHAVVAENGQRAVEMVEGAVRRRRPFTMAFMDVQMPHMDGNEATRRIRSMGVGSDALPIIAFTATYDDSRARDCLAAGMQDAVAKPLDISLLNRLLERWCGDIRPMGV